MSASCSYDVISFLSLITLIIYLRLVLYLMLNFFTTSSIFKGAMNRLSLNLLPSSGAVKNDPKMLVPTFLTILCKKGIKRENVLASVNSRLKHSFQTDNPIQIAIDAIKPVLKYKKLKGLKKAVPVVLNEKTQINTAIKWIVDSASSKQYNQKPSLEKGLYDEISSILLGTSSLFTKRFQFHRNPNQ